MKDDHDKNENKHSAADREQILMALDQISQTIEVMNGVVGRLRSYVEAQKITQDTGPRATMSSDRILH